MVPKKLCLMATLCLAFTAGPGHSQEFPVQGISASGLPGEQVFVRLVYDYGGSFSVIAEDLQFEYQASAMTFNPDASTINVAGNQRTLTQFTDTLRTFAQQHQGNLLVNLNPTVSLAGYKGYAMSFYTADGIAHTRSGPAQLDIAFDILPDATEGSYPVSFTTNNVLADADGNEFKYPAALQNLSVTVMAAVPEPLVSLMLLPGIAVVFWRTRGRRRDCNRSG